MKEGKKFAFTLNGEVKRHNASMYFLKKLFLISSLLIGHLCSSSSQVYALNPYNLKASPHLELKNRYKKYLKLCLADSSSTKALALETWLTEEAFLLSSVKEIVGLYEFIDSYGEIDSEKYDFCRYKMAQSLQVKWENNYLDEALLHISARDRGILLTSGLIFGVAMAKRPDKLARNFGLFRRVFQKAAPKVFVLGGALASSPKGHGFESRSFPPAPASFIKLGLREKKDDLDLSAQSLKTEMAKTGISLAGSTAISAVAIRNINKIKSTASVAKVAPHAVKGSNLVFMVVSTLLLDQAIGVVVDSAVEGYEREEVLRPFYKALGEVDEYLKEKKLVKLMAATERLHQATQNLILYLRVPYMEIVNAFLKAIDDQILDHFKCDRLGVKYGPYQAGVLEIQASKIYLDKCRSSLKSKKSVTEFDKLLDSAHLLLKKYTLKQMKKDGSYHQRDYSKIIMSENEKDQLVLKVIQYLKVNKRDFSPLKLNESLNFSAFESGELYPKVSPVKIAKVLVKKFYEESLYPLKLSCGCVFSKEYEDKIFLKYIINWEHEIYKKQKKMLLEKIPLSSPLYTAMMVSSYLKASGSMALYRQGLVFEKMGRDEKVRMNKLKNSKTEFELLSLF